MIAASCPKCGRHLMTLTQHKTQVQPTFNEYGFSVIQLKCGYADCQHLVGIVPDHGALVDEVANAVVDKLRKAGR